MKIIDYFIYLVFRFFHYPPVGKDAGDAKQLSVLISGWILGMFIMMMGYSYLLCTKDAMIFYIKERSPIIGILMTFVIWACLSFDHYLIRRKTIFLLDEKYNSFTRLRRRIIKWIAILSIIIVCVTLFVLNRYVDMLLR